MKVAAFQHTADEPPGYFETYFSERNIPCEYVRLYDTNEIPRTDATHFIFLGGPMSVNHEQEFPFLKEEKEFIRKIVQKKYRVLGICLGAQLIASAHGAAVYMSVNETGWQPLMREPGCEGICSQFPGSFYAFQLHNETFEIPYGGKRLCTGTRVKNQAFSYKTALGMQFHLELTEEIIRSWSRGLRHPMQEKINRDTPRYLAESNRLCQMIAEDFICH